MEKLTVSCVYVSLVNNAYVWNIRNYSSFTALDPAGPGFGSDRPSFRKLSRDDALLVTVFHTECSFVGLNEQLGDLDVVLFNCQYHYPGCDMINMTMDTKRWGINWDQITRMINQLHSSL